MMKMYRFVFALLGLALLATGWSCTPTQTQTKTEPLAAPRYQRIQDYYPLQVGDRRVYRIQYNRFKTIQRTIQITHKKGNSFYDNQRGSYTIDSYGLQANKLRYLLKYPLRKGKKWLSVTGVTSVERYQIIDTNRTVTVPAGTYPGCIVVRSREKVGPGRFLEAMHYYAPQIGPVKITTVVQQNNRRLPQWKLELVAYYPNAKPTKTTTPPAATPTTPGNAKQ